MDAKWQLFSHVLGIHNLDERTVFGISPAFWSIGVEIQLYLIYPALVAIAARVGWSRALGATIVCEVFLRLLMAGQVLTGHTWLPFWIGMSPLYFWFSWSVGAYLAEHFLKKKETWLARTPALPFLLIALGSSWFRPLFIFQFTAWALLTAVAIERFINKKWNPPKKGVIGIAWKHLSALGIISYSFYLLHQPLMAWTWSICEVMFSKKEVHPLERMLVGSLWYPVLLLISWFYFLVLEKQSIALGKKALEKYKQ